MRPLKHSLMHTRIRAKTMKQLSYLVAELEREILVSRRHPGGIDHATGRFVPGTDYTRNLMIELKRRRASRLVDVGALEYPRETKKRERLWLRMCRDAGWQENKASESPVQLAINRRPSKAQLFSWYVAHQMAQRQIARRCGVSQPTVRRWLDKCGIVRRNRSESQKLVRLRLRQAKRNHNE